MIDDPFGVQMGGLHAEGGRRWAKRWYAQQMVNHGTKYQESNAAVKRVERRAHANRKCARQRGCSLSLLHFRQRNLLIGVHGRSRTLVNVGVWTITEWSL